MKVGRNDPCSCGSGRKHKHCCGASSAPDPAELQWQRLQRVTSQLPEHFLTFTRRQHGETALSEAWDEFRSYSGEPFDPQSIHIPVFLPWFFYNWTPDPHGSEIPEERWDDFPVSRGYLRHQGARVDPLVARWIDACLEEPLTYYDVVDVSPGWGLTLRDIMRDVTVDVIERTASQTLEAGSIILAKVVPAGGVTVLAGCSAIAFPPIEKKAVLGLRRQIEKAGEVRADVLLDFDLEMIWLYVEVTERLLNPAPPILTNTDGDHLAFSTVTYEISSARAALEALSPLAVGLTLEKLLESAELDETGDIDSVEFGWVRPGKAAHGPTSNVTLGMITIEPSRLRAEVNSEERAARFRELADELLPTGSHYLSTVIEPLEAAMRRVREERAGRGPEEDEDHEDLNQRPEVQAMLADLRRAHYREWVDMELPALDGKTPRQAMRTRDGREMVEALLAEFEQSDRRQPLPGSDEIMRELRDTLAEAARRPRSSGRAAPAPSPTDG